MNKKGDINILFKWMFGIIAGALILAFFIRLSYVHISGGTTLEGNLLLVDVDDKLDALGISEGNDIIDLKDNFNLGVNCGKITLDTYERKTDKIIFSPLNINGEQINVWTQKWKFPYGITTFFYISNTKNRILLISDASQINYVANFAKKIPLNMGLQTITKQLFKPEGFTSQAKGSDKITLVFFGKSTYNVQQLKTIYGTDVNIEIIEVDMESNTARIYDNYGNVENVFYLGDEMLYGIIFSGTQYTCTKDFALDRLKVLTELYVQKTGQLMGKSNNEQKCVDLLNEARILLEKYRKTEQKNEYYSINDAIEKQNRKLEKENCAPVY